MLCSSGCNCCVPDETCSGGRVCEGPCGTTQNGDVFTCQCKPGLVRIGKNCVTPNTCKQFWFKPIPIGTPNDDPVEPKSKCTCGKLQAVVPILESVPDSSASNPFAKYLLSVIKS